MDTPSSFFDAPSDLAEWLPLFGSIVRALRGAAESPEPGPAQAQDREAPANLGDETG